MQPHRALLTFYFSIRLFSSLEFTKEAPFEIPALPAPNIIAALAGAATIAATAAGPIVEDMDSRPPLTRERTSLVVLTLRLR